MTIILCNISAMEFWRYDRLGAQRQPSHDTTLRRNSAQFRKLDAKQIESLRTRGFSFLSDPVHVLVPEKRMRIKNAHVCCHIRPEQLPRDSFVKIAEGVFVCRPEAAFVQEATRLSLAQEVLAGLELCGAYRRSVGSRSTIYQQPPLTNASALASYVSKAGSMRGTVAARQALRYIADGSESPMESILIVLFCFPVRLGGYGLPMPIPNFSISTTDSVRRATGKESFRCDLVWPEAKLAIEYDSRERHSTVTECSNDTARHAGLVRMGFDVLPITARNVKNVNELDIIAESIAKRLGRRIRPTERDWSDQRNRLRNDILPWKIALP